MTCWLAIVFPRTQLQISSNEEYFMPLLVMFMFSTQLCCIHVYIIFAFQFYVNKQPQL